MSINVYIYICRYPCAKANIFTENLGSLPQMLFLTEKHIAPDGRHIFYFHRRGDCITHPEQPFLHFLLRVVATETTAHTSRIRKMLRRHCLFGGGARVWTCNLSAHPFLFSDFAPHPNTAPQAPHSSKVCTQMAPTCFRK